MMTRLTPGRVLGYRYTLLAPIASGGMGDVWSATDDILLREVAVKVVRPADDPGFRNRFRDEARTSAALQHANIAAVYDYGDEDGLPFLVMELVPGRPLSELIREAGLGGLEPDRVRSVIGQAALALSAAHEAGVVHRDVKPANIIITPEGQPSSPTSASPAPARERTHPHRRDPRHARVHQPRAGAGSPASAASDLYSLAIVTHEMLSGAKPFDAGSPVATAVAQVNDPPPPLPAWVPGDLRTIIEACLDKSPDRRPSDARAVAEALLDPSAGMPLGSLTPPLASQPSLAFQPSLASQPSPTSDVEWPADPHPATQVLAVVGAPHDSPPSERSRGERHTTRKRVPWAWLAVPAVALVVWIAFAFGSTTWSQTPAASPTSVAGPHTTTPVTNPSTATGTISTTRATSTRTGSTSTSTDAVHVGDIGPAAGLPPRQGQGKGKEAMMKSTNERQTP